jgi:succinyl-diaminopimelate desuccinylase
VAPFYVDPETPALRALLSTYEEYSGNPGKAFTIGGGTYARHFRCACAFGPHDPAEKTPAWVGMEHGPDEAVSEESLRRALKIYIVSIARLMQLSF